MGRSGASIILDRLAKQLARSAFLVPEIAIDTLVCSIAYSDRFTEIEGNSELNVSHLAEAILVPLAIGSALQTHPYPISTFVPPIETLPTLWG